MIFTKTNEASEKKVSKLLALMMVVALFIVLPGCDREITYEPIDYQVTDMTLAYPFPDMVILDTQELSESETSGIMEDINDYLSTAEVMTNVEPKEIADSQTMLMVFITEDGEELKIGGVQMRYDGEEGLCGRVHVDGEAIGYLDPETYEGLKESFDADSYVQEN